MNNLLTLHYEINKTNEFIAQLSTAIKKNIWIEIVSSEKKSTDIPHKLLPKNPGVIITSSGSTGGPNKCLHPFLNLDQSANATGEWLIEQNLLPRDCIIFNPLSMHHIAGLMPWWRSRSWGAEHIFITPETMRNPILLIRKYKEILAQKNYNLLISLVPTQLHRLLSHPEGIKFLKAFAIIWVGGALLPESIAKAAREKKINLAPCYGASETAAMISALKPKDFLEGQNNCGDLLQDVKISIDKNNNLKVRTNRIAIGHWKNETLETIQTKDGWWESGDIAKIVKNKRNIQLKILGRIDTAINTGGETIFPEVLESRLLESAKQKGIPLKNTIFLSLNDKEWGDKLTALTKWEEELNSTQEAIMLKKLTQIVSNWPPEERPKSWINCPELKRNRLGKYERFKWFNWLDNHKNIT
tara:strand:- start:1759 stop:3000 length:1242 start_codon:yes stop_codon:yes gene_type:complete